MSLARQVLAQVEAETRTRLRSASTIVAVLVLFAASFLWIPDPATNATSISWTIGGQRYSAVYGSPYVGTASAILSSLFLSLIGFYLVAGSVRRDARTGVGPILAATPLSNAAYLLGKAAASVAYLWVIAFLAMGGGILVFARHGAGPFSPGAFLVPFVLFVLPAMAMTGLMSLLFDVTPGLRGRGGLVLWFFAWALVLLLPVADRPAGSGFPAYDPLGMGAFHELIQRSAPGAEGISIGLNIGGPRLTRVPWPGLEVDRELLGTRSVQPLFWAVPFGLALLFFRRFDPARARWLRVPRPARPEEAPLRGASGEAGDAARGPASSVPHLSELGGVRGKPSFLRSVLAEARLVWDGAPLLRWPLLAAAVLAGALPAEGRTAAASVLLLLVAPVVSEVAARETLAGAEGLVFAQPGVPESRLLWKLASVGLFLGALGLPATVRAAFQGPMALAAFLLGLAFVAAFAVAAGTLTSGGKLFSGVYVAVWYAAVNRAPAFDFTGALAGSPDPLVSLGWLAGSAALLLPAALLERRRAA